MQIRVKDIEKKEKVFHPFVLEFKIESEQDLIDLRAKFTLYPETINRFIELEYRKHGSNNYSDEWNFLNNLLENKPYMK